MVKKNSIPDRWRNLTAIGQRVPGSRFIAFKVPLKGVTNQRVTENQKFTPKDLITAIRTQNEELGLIVDLTNTERYYTTKDLPKGIQYVKLHTAGLKIPDDATIHQFKRVVWKFLVANSENDKLIGVHCTTGINRTGYLICRYLIDVDGWRPMNALSAFGQARGHPIEGTVYIEDIVKGPPRSNVGIDSPPTTEETRAWDTGTYYAPDTLSRERGVRDEAIRPLLELIPGNEHADFDARDRRPLPLMRARSDEYQEDGRNLFNSRAEFRGRGLPIRDMSDDVDLRKQEFPSNMQERVNERLRRPVDFNPDGRFNPGVDNRRDFHGSEPRPLMDVRDNYGPRDVPRPRGMPQEQMGYGDTREQQSPVQGYNDYNEPSSYNVPSLPPGKMNSAGYGSTEAERIMRSLISDLDFRARLRRQEFQSMESESDPREREMRTDTSQGPFNERMQPRNARTLEGPMSERINARNSQLLGEPVNEMMPPRNRRDMEGPNLERMYSRDPRYMDGSANEGLPQRDTQGTRNLMDERMQLQNVRPMSERMQSRDAQFTEGPMNHNRMYPREAQQVEPSTNQRLQTRVARILNERLNPRDGQALENSLNDRIPTRALNRPINEMLNPRDPRSMEGPMNARMQPRIDRGMEGTMNDQMHSRQGAMNERMPIRDTRPMEGLMNARIYQRDVRTVQGSMNEQMHPRDARAMEGSVNERMYPQEDDFPMNKPRDLMSDPRSFEARKMNPSEDSLRGANRFAPYPSLMKSGQPAENARGLPGYDNRDPREMLPPSQDATRFLPRSRFT
ncbi:uncharacterized protein LOC121003728 [Bufo bufo]|uniref:uncharacterized protein LOC121003728 n=1 Tax=Bufo bufo TaxID=8384 RepID=UPI001ABE8DF4|nr:uncharacterized protein LOC121003728 [Bufo bufo]